MFFFEFFVRLNKKHFLMFQIKNEVLKFSEKLPGKVFQSIFWYENSRNEVQKFSLEVLREKYFWKQKKFLSASGTKTIRRKILIYVKILNHKNQCLKQTKTKIKRKLN